jgi:amino acid transporter
MIRSPKKSKMRFWTTVSAMFVIYCGGPYGIEEVVVQSGPTLAIFGLLFMAVFWGIPGILQNGELVSSIPMEGGIYQWYKKSWGRYWGFQLGWLEWLTWMFDAALYPTLLAEYFVIFIWPDAPFIFSYGLTLSMIWLSVILNIRGVNLVGPLFNALYWIQIIPIIIFIYYGLGMIDLSIYSTLHLPPETELQTAVVFALIFGLWNFSGYSGLASAADEIEDIETNYPKALIITLIVSVFAYVIPLMIGIAVDPNWAQWDEAQLNLVALALGGTAFAWWFSIAAQTSNFGLINGEMLLMSHLLKAISDDGHLPKAISTINQNNGTPVGALITQGIVLSIMTMGMNFVDLLVVGTWISIPLYIIGFFVFISLRYSKPDLLRPFKVSGGMIFPWITVIVPTIIALFIFFFTPEHYLMEAIPLLLSGFVIYWGWNRFNS